MKKNLYNISLLEFDDAIIVWTVFVQSSMTRRLAKCFLGGLLFNRICVLCPGFGSLGEMLAAQAVCSHLIRWCLPFAASASHGLVSPYIPSSWQPPLVCWRLPLQGTCGWEGGGGCWLRWWHKEGKEREKCLCAGDVWVGVGNESREVDRGVGWGRERERQVSMCWGCEMGWAESRRREVDWSGRMEKRESSVSVWELGWEMKVGRLVEVVGWV